MKRLLAFAVLTCMLLCGCEADSPPSTDPATEPTQEQIQLLTEPTAENTPATKPTHEATIEPTQAKTETVTVYLLEELILYDSGSTEYHYDENYNIDSYTVFTIENEPMYTAYFEEKDSNGMACRYRAEWPGAAGGETRTLTYFADGKLKEEQYDGSLFSGYQYAYDLKGDVTEKREYYDGTLQTVVYYEYNGEILESVYCEDQEGNKLFDCLLENGRITEKICFDSDSNYSYLYEYDENNNLIQTTILYEDEMIPCEQYSYKAVEVEAARAWYLLEQQKYLLPIA